MMATPKISVALAAYRGEKYISGQVKSLLEQSVVPDEIIICDDSPDDSVEQALAEFSGCPALRYFRNEAQLGICRNFEKAISLCKGEVIFLCDQDDLWLPQKIEIMVQALTQNPRCDGVFCDSSVVDEKLVPMGFTHWQMCRFTPRMKRQMATDSLGVMLKRIPAAAHNIAFRRRALSYLLPFPELSPFYADTWIALQTALHGEFGMVPSALTLYRVHGENVSAPQQTGVGAQFALSRKARSNNSIERTVALAEEMISRMPSDISSAKAAAVRGYLQHNRKRQGFSKNIFIRAFQVSGELLGGRYHRYSGGWKRAAADILLGGRAE